MKYLAVSVEGIYTSWQEHYCHEDSDKNSFINDLCQIYGRIVSVGVGHIEMADGDKQTTITIST